jgi:hypothetical protein
LGHKHTDKSKKARLFFDHEHWYCPENLVHVVETSELPSLCRMEEAQKLAAEIGAGIKNPARDI